MQHELQELLKSWKIYINKIDNILALLIEHIHHSWGQSLSNGWPTFKTHFIPSPTACLSVELRLIWQNLDWLIGAIRIPLQGEALYSNAKFPQLLNFVPRLLLPSETCQFACGGLAEKKTSPDGEGWHSHPPQPLKASGALISFEKGSLIEEIIVRCLVFLPLEASAPVY